MSIGRRLQAFLDSNSQSLRDAESVSGVSRATVGRICAGYFGPTTETHVKRIVAAYKAAGYQIELQQILEGRDPKGDFEWAVLHSSPGQRAAFLSMPIQGRVRLTLSFLQARYPDIAEPERLIAASGLTTAQVQMLLAAWDFAAPDITTALTLARGIHRVTGISLSWFRFGWLEPEAIQTTLAEGIRQACFGERTRASAVKAALENVQTAVRFA